MIKKILKMFQNELDISIEKAKELIDSGEYILIDVRTDREYSDSKIKGSKLIDISSEIFEAKISALDKNKRYIVYCRTGARSSYATKIMKEKGFLEVYNMKGGIIAWQMKNYPILS